MSKRPELQRLLSGLKKLSLNLIRRQRRGQARRG